MAARTARRTDELGKPNPLNKHQQRTEATKEKLLDSAYQVFTRDGFEAARIEDVAALAGFTRGAFYAHFQTKADLFFALLEKQVAEKYQKIIPLLQDCKTDEERAEIFRRFYLKRAADKQWAILMIEFKLHALRKGQLRERLAESHRNIRKTMNAWLHNSLPGFMDCSEEDMDLARAGLEAAWIGLLLERAYDPKRLSEAQVRDLLGQVFDALITSTV